MYDYRGRISHTEYEYECHKQTPKTLGSIGIYDYEFVDNDIYAAHNYCRNPGNLHLRPWCYTIHEVVRSQFRAVPLCNVTDELNKI